MKLTDRAFDVRDEDGKPFSDAAYVRHLEKKVQSLHLLLEEARRHAEEKKHQQADPVCNGD